MAWPSDAVDWPNALKKYRVLSNCEAIMHKHQSFHAAPLCAASFFIMKGC
jgi:hypothetical protein